MPRRFRYCEERSDEAIHVWTARCLQDGSVWLIWSLAVMCPACWC
ncbi:hypothetical protein CYD53_11894, partial [Bosea psychrotolerans]